LQGSETDNLKSRSDHPREIVGSTPTPASILLSGDMDIPEVTELDDYSEVEPGTDNFGELDTFPDIFDKDLED